MIQTQGNIIITQGATFIMIVTLKDTDGVALNTTGYTFDSDICSEAGAVKTVSFTCTHNNAGVVTMTLTSTNTLLLTDTDYVYDLRGTVGSVKSIFLRGMITVKPQITGIVVPPES
jgi:hypothetical protein